MHFSRYFMLLATIPLIFFACGSKKQLTSETTTPLARLQGSWKLAQLEGRSAESLQAVPVIEFDTRIGRLYGSEGCRAIGGTFDARSEWISIGNLETRDEDCNIQGSSAFLNTLRRVNGYRIADNQLVLVRGETELLRFDRVD